ncbi:MAG TPA: Holliday junction branch migration protein RuvA [Rhodocyclaceae bacterium]|nr:Holliday junction branch migration protein RuvA [Rhodocyclaceae bacterium]
MIGRISGILAEKNPPQILVDVGGVGYEIDVPMSSFYNLPNIGDKVTLLTEFIVREDAQLLFGFLTHDERMTFRQLLKVSGVGARTALAVLSGMSVADLAHAVAMQEVGRLTKVPGIGKKTAERLLLELKDKLPKAPGVAAGGNAPMYVPNTTGDILNALMALGYNEREALSAMKNLPEDVTVSEGIRQALKLLGKG